MRDVLFSLFEVSLTMGAVIALLLALAPVWKRRFRPQWRYWAWLLVALRLAVPVNIPLPQAPVTLAAPSPVELSAAWVDAGAEGFQGVEFAARPASAGAADTASETAADTRRLSLTGAELAFWVWCAGAAGVLAVQLVRYAAFRRHTRRWSAPAGEYGGIPVFACPLLSAPVLVGLIRPRILLPEGLTGEKRAYALAHEAAHAKRRDLWYKALLLWVCALHWFNPLVWALRRAAERDVEICCDAAALAGRDEGWRRGYGAALLSFVSAKPAAPLTSQFSGGVRGLKERFRALVSAAPARRGRLALALVMCAALLGGSLVACRTQEAPEETEAPTGTPPGEVIDSDDLADGTYWATVPTMNWWAAGEDGLELSILLVELDEDTMTLADGYLEGVQAVTLPVAEDVELGNHSDGGLSGFLSWFMLSSYYPLVLEVEVSGGEITAMTWHDAKLPLDPDPLSQWEQKADHPASHYTGLPDGTYWAIPLGATDWEEGEKRGRELSLRSVTMDPDTMTVTTTDGTHISLPVAEDAVLGGGETELSDFLNRPDWGTGAVLELEVSGGEITALTAREARFSPEESAPDGDYIIGDLYDFRAETDSGFPICFKARIYEVEEDTWRVTNSIGISTFRVDEAELCREDGTPYAGGVVSFLNEFCADSNELQRRRGGGIYPFINRLTLQATVRGGYITSLTRLPEPEW